MFDIGWSELLVIAVVAVVVIGPKELPRLMRTFGHYTGKVRRAAAEFQRQFDDAIRETEIDEVRKAMRDFQDTSHNVNLKASIDTPLMTPNPPQASVGPETLPPPSVSIASSEPKPKRKRAAPNAAKSKPVKAETAEADGAAPSKKRRSKRQAS